MARHTFSKGNKVGGRKKIPDDIKKAFELATPEAVNVLIDLMRNGEDDMVRLKAATEIINRHLGKPVQAVDLGNKSDKPFIIQVL